MSNYSTRRGRPLGVSEQGFHGVGTNMNLFALDGESEIVTVFDDFNGFVASDTFGAVGGPFETQGWDFVDVGTPANDTINMNDPSIQSDFYSCLHITCGDAASGDEGGNMQLRGASATIPTPTAAGGGGFPHITIPDSGTVTALDDTVITFGCRLGIVSNATTFDGKIFIGFAEDGDTAIMTAATGALVAATGGLQGFHVTGDAEASMRFISQRTAAVAFAEGTNMVALLDDTDITAGYTAGVPRVFDLTFRIHSTDMSDDDANGFSQCAWREVYGQTAPGMEAFALPGEGYNSYNLSNTLTNQSPNSATHMVPTIEAINGPTNITQFKIDWWTMGISRYTLKNLF